MTLTLFLTLNLTLKLTVKALRHLHSPNTERPLTVVGLVNNVEQLNVVFDCTAVSKHEKRTRKKATTGAATCLL